MLPGSPEAQGVVACLTADLLFSGPIRLRAEVDSGGQHGCRPCGLRHPGVELCAGQAAFGKTDEIEYVARQVAGCSALETLAGEDAVIGEFFESCSCRRKGDSENALDRLGGQDGGFWKQRE